MAIREDTHKKVFFCGRTTEGVGRRTPPPRPLSKKTLFKNKYGFLAQKFEKKKKLSNPFQAIIKKNGMDH